LPPRPPGCTNGRAIVTKNNEMKKYLLVIALIGLVAGVNAQSNSLGSSDPNAKKVLDAVSS